MLSMFYCEENIGSWFDILSVFILYKKKNNSNIPEFGLQINLIQRLYCF